MTAILKFLIGPLGRWLLGAVGILTLAGAIWLHGEHYGAKRVRAQWDAAEARQYDKGVKARENAEKSIPAAVKPGKPCAIRDKFDRDCGGK